MISLLVSAALTWGATYAMASGVHLRAPALGAGSASVSSCQAAPLHVSFGSSPAGVLEVTVRGLDTAARACGGKALAVTLHASTHTDHERTTTVPTSGSTVTIDYPDVAAADVIGATVAVSG